MNIMRRTCGTCSGFGMHSKLTVIEINDDGTFTTKPEEVMCNDCGGKGYTEYAEFTVEEAKAILKHCGLSVESTQ